MTEYDTFIPMISVKMSYMGQLGYNAVVKLDDKDFKATTAEYGVIVYMTLQDRKVFQLDQIYQR